MNIDELRVNLRRFSRSASEVEVHPWYDQDVERLQDMSHVLTYSRPAAWLLYVSFR